MVSLTVYPQTATAFPELTPWQNPFFAEGPPDGLCAAHAPNYTNQTLQLTDWDFSSLPNDAIIDHVYVGQKTKLTNAFSPTSRIVINIIKGFVTVGYAEVSPTGGIPQCANAGNVESNADLSGLTVNDLKTEAFQAWVYDSYGGLGTDVTHVDCVWIRVEYHLPLVAVGSGNAFIPTNIICMLRGIRYGKRRKKIQVLL